jgi:hypothetical protein
LSTLILLQPPTKKQPQSTQRYERAKLECKVLETLNIALQRLDPAVYKEFLILTLTSQSGPTLRDRSIIELANELFNRIETAPSPVVDDLQMKLRDTMKFLQGAIILL